MIYKRTLKIQLFSGVDKKTNTSDAMPQYFLKATQMPLAL